MAAERIVVIDVARRIRPGSYLFFFALIAAVVFCTHLPLLELPFYWDELGQFVPASLDLFHHGAWIPQTTLPNIHPPGVMAYLAAFWSVTGYSIAATRCAMLLLASVGAFLTFLLAIRLGRESSGFPAFTALLFLCLSPLFVAQAMLAQLDMPAMVLTTLSLLLFLQNRIKSAALASVMLVMVKETGIVAPMVFGAWLLWEKRGREALLFAAPLLPLGVWLVVLHRATGYWTGNAPFAAYNAVYLLHPVRFALAILRRLYYLFLGTGHWIGTLALVWTWRHTRIFQNREWKIVLLFAGAHTLLISLFGGAVLERYLMPLLPILYIAFAVALATLSLRRRLIGTFLLFPLLLLANFVNPPYPYPWENNLGFVTTVTLHQRATDFVENTYPGGTIASVFPLTGALRRPEFGYVSQSMKVREIEDFQPAHLLPLNENPPDALIVYSTMWDPLHLLENKKIADWLHRYYGYEPQATREQMEKMLHLRLVAHWGSRGQWAEVFDWGTPRSHAITVELLPGTKRSEAGVLMENVDFPKSRLTQ